MGCQSLAKCLLKLVSKELIKRLLAAMTLLTLKTKKGVKTPRTMRTKDHVVPRCQDERPKGTRRVKVDACYGCNQDKGGLTLEEYRLIVAFRAGVQPMSDVLFNAEKLEILFDREEKK